MTHDDATTNPYAAPETLGRPIEPGPEDGPTGPGGAYRVAYQNTEEDIAALLLQVRRGSRVGRYLPMGIPLLAAAVGLGFVLRMPAGPGRWISAGSFLLPALVAAAVSRSSQRRGMKSAARKFKPRPAQTVEIGPAGLVVRLEDGSAEARPWGMVSRVVADASVILLYTTERGPGRASMAHVVPRRAFATPEAAEAFLRAATRWWQEARAAGGEAAPPAPGVAGAGGAGPEVAYELEGDEPRVARRANRSVFRHLWRRRPALLLAAALSAGGFAVTRHAEDGPQSAALMGMVTVWQGAAALLALLAARLWWFILFGVRPDPKDRGPVVLAIAPAGLTLRRAGGREGFFSWSRVQAIRADGRFLRLVLESSLKGQVDGGTILIPRRAFPTAAQADEFLADARRWHASAPGRGVTS